MPQPNAAVLRSTSKKSKRYVARPFNGRADLIALLCLGSPDSYEEDIAEKPQVIYLTEFLTRLGVKTIVFEPKYVDRHFSEDYSGHYVKCYGLYEKKCSRLHYFATAFTQKAFNAWLVRSPDPDQLGYRGFTVIKPLPKTVIGRTCVSPPSNGSFVAPMSRPNLCGVDLRVHALPFQEQDREVAACATSALWSCLHGTSGAFEHQTLTPVQITKQAIAGLPRSFPNDGLNIEQMGHVLHSLGLDGDVIELNTRDVKFDAKFRLQAAIGAYLPIGIPPVLSFDFNLTSKGPASGHAVAVTGYEANGPLRPFQGYPNIYRPRSSPGFLLRASRIDRIFVHDDGVGPYCPLTFAKKNGVVVTAWLDDPSSKTPSQAELWDLLVPLYHHVRVRCMDALSAVMAFDLVYEILRRNTALPALEWDVYLDRGVNAKKHVIAAYTDDRALRARSLTASLPHYIWRAAAYSDGQCRFEFLLDATDLRQGNWFIRLLNYDKSFCASVGRVFRAYNIRRRVIRYATAWSAFEAMRAE